MKFEDISLRSRRFNPRFEWTARIDLLRKGIFQRRLSGTVENISTNGFLVRTPKAPKNNQLALLQISSHQKQFEVECVWVKPAPHRDSYYSGWKLSDRRKQADLSSFLATLGPSVLTDRRTQSDNPTSKRRLDEIMKEESILAPDEFPFYRRKNTEDRRMKHRRSNSVENHPERRKSDDRRSKNRRGSTVIYSPEQSFLEKSLTSVGSILRDALIPYMPNAAVRLLVGKGEFVFIAHPRDQRDVVRMFPFAKWFPEKWIKKWFMRQKPFIGSRITGMKDLNGNPVNGWFLIAPRWTVQMMKDNEMARKCIADTARLAEKLGSKIAGLGAFTSIVTHDGKDLINQSKIGLTTGNPLSAAIAVQNVVKASSLVGLKLEDSTVAIVGAGGSVGSGCARVLAKKVGRLILIDINQRSLDALFKSLNKPAAAIQLNRDLSHILEADVVVVATNTPGAIIHSQHLKSGSIVIDCAQPKNVSDEVPKMRGDVIVIESAVLLTPSVDCHFDLDLNRHEALGCLAETMVLTSMHWPSTYAIGKSQEHQVEEIYAAAKRAGFRLAYFRNSRGYITEGSIERVRKIIASKRA